MISSIMREKIPHTGTYLEHNSIFLKKRPPVSFMSTDFFIIIPDMRICLNFFLIRIIKHACDCIVFYISSNKKPAQWTGFVKENFFLFFLAISRTTTWCFTTTKNSSRFLHKNSKKQNRKLHLCQNTGEPLKTTCINWFEICKMKS